MNDPTKITKNNPHGAVFPCGDRAFHPPHQYQAELGHYTDTYCPGKQAGKKTVEAAQRLIDTALHVAEGEGVFKAAADGERVLKALGVDLK